MWQPRTVGQPPSCVSQLGGCSSCPAGEQSSETCPNMAVLPQGARVFSFRAESPRMGVISGERYMMVGAILNGNNPANLILVAHSSFSFSSFRILKYQPALRKDISYYRVHQVKVRNVMGKGSWNSNCSPWESSQSPTQSSTLFPLSWRAGGDDVEVGREGICSGLNCFIDKLWFFWEMSFGSQENKALIRIALSNSHNCEVVRQEQMLSP